MQSIVHCLTCLFCLFSHCRSCGHCICNNCSRSRAKLSVINSTEPVRVCIECQCSLQCKSRGLTTSSLLKLIQKHIKTQLKTIQKDQEEQRNKLQRQPSSHRKLEFQPVTELNTANSFISLLSLSSYSRTIPSSFDPIRLKHGFILPCIILPSDKPINTIELNLQQQRWLILLPKYNLFCLTGLINQVMLTDNDNDNDDDEQIQQNDVKFHSVYTIDEIQLVRSVDITLAKQSSFQPSLQILFHPTFQKQKQQTTFRSIMGEVSERLNNNAERRNSIGQTLQLLIIDSDDQLSLTKKFTLHQESLHTTTIFLQQYNEITKTVTDTLEKAYVDMKIAVSWANVQHVELLQRLWSSWSIDNTSEFPGMKSEKWSLLGFQGTDPVTDFRGMGLLGLTTLVYLGENHNSLLKPLVKLQSEREYPLACTVINLLSMICELCGIGGGNETNKSTN